MDAAEVDQDVQLQGASSDLIADFQKSLNPFLWRTLKNGDLKVRLRVRSREADRLIALLEPFQELPQLLDPHLGQLLPVLADALLEYLRVTAHSSRISSSTNLLQPLSRAISKLLYTFCKIRGEKVVVRFFSSETKNLELLLSALEIAEATNQQDVTDNDILPGWGWEERYICLLWLSHLLLAPFDLSTISSTDAANAQETDIKGLTWPSNLPGVTLRVVPLAIKYLGSAGKERDSAKLLLVRISMRKDMQEAGLFQSLIHWALFCLNSSHVMTSNSPYFTIGVLSFVAGVLVSSINTADMDSYLSQIFRTVQTISDVDTVAFKHVYSSATARKTIIKILRTVTVIALRSHSGISPLQPADVNEITEATIGQLIEALADNDTSVRLAASKSLSVITVKLTGEMAGQVVDALLESLKQNVLWGNTSDIRGVGTRDLSAVNPLEWHGLILTLAHLIYRHSLPASDLSPVIDALVIGLNFEQRSTSGTSIGTNVRDAACFGIWALARRYTTEELQGSAQFSAFMSDTDAESSLFKSNIQTLATELVVSASLDPAGNIRRGASAALQELIGRHPDTVDKGIAVVQVVDYHAVALRSRAVLEVSVNAARLSIVYERALLGSLLGWRGVGDGSASSRRIAAQGVGCLARGFRVASGNGPWHAISSLISRILLQISRLKPRELDQKHGLLLSMSAAITALPLVLDTQVILNGGDKARDIMATTDLVLRDVLTVLQDVTSSSYRRPEAIAEAVSCLITASSPVIRIARVLQEVCVENGAVVDKKSQESRLAILSSLLCYPASILQSSTYEVGELIAILETVDPCDDPVLADLVSVSKDLLSGWLERSETEVLDATSEASANLIVTMNATNRSLLIQEWIGKVSKSSDGRGTVALGHLFALAAAFPYISDQQQIEICTIVVQLWKISHNIESKVVLLQCLTRGTFMSVHTSHFIDMIAEGMDDYTTDARGDIGSLVRLEGIKAAGEAFKSIPWDSIKSGLVPQNSNSWYMDLDRFTVLYERVLRLSAEKLDKVRIQAQQSLSLVIQKEDEMLRYRSFLPSSQDYFLWLLNLQINDWILLPQFDSQNEHWRISLFEGFVTSADTGSEGLIQASRAALAQFSEENNGYAVGYNTAGKDSMDAKNLVCHTLVDVVRRHLANDRVLVPALETIGFLFDIGVMQTSNVTWAPLYLLVQKSHYKSGNVRKLEAAVKIYGALTDVYPKAIVKLSAMLLHPFPSIRAAVSDAIFDKMGFQKGIDFRATKEEVKAWQKSVINEVSV